MGVLMKGVTRFLHEEAGPTATEYAVLLAVISMATLVAMAGFGNGVNGIYAAIDGAVNGAS